MALVKTLDSMLEGSPWTPLFDDLYSRCRWSDLWWVCLGWVCLECDHRWWFISPCSCSSRICLGLYSCSIQVEHYPIIWIQGPNLMNLNYFPEQPSVGSNLNHWFEVEDLAKISHLSESGTVNRRKRNKGRMRGKMTRIIKLEFFCINFI